MSNLQPVRGTTDLLPEEWRLFRYIENTSLETAALFGFEGIETPIFEFTPVFSRAVGETSDIVSKEMYTFEDRGGESITLRPEGTAGVARAFLSNGMAQSLPLKLIYSGPMFRYERPQKGRQRQFHSVGVELLGVATPQADIEVITLGYHILKNLKVMDQCSLEINTIGDAESRAQYRDALVEYFGKYRGDLSEDSLIRLEKNPLRILDSKDKKDQSLITGAPKFSQYLNDDSKKFYDEVREGLHALEISFTENEKLVRGLDYYCHTVFEFISNTIGAQSAVLSGGRYDGLVQLMGGKPTPGAGWGAGIERLALMVQKSPLEKKRPIALIPLGEEAQKEALKMAHQLRHSGLPIEHGYSGNLGKRMKRADKLNAIATLILGEEEIKNRTVTLKKLDSGEQVTLKLDDSFERELHALY